ncbi:trimeric intracellular cation channel family protein [Aestuariibaculum sp. YM273]|uniref:trimeric intracellular cation channel family protein n=1 Tax=Aestuariibaculum sp. YM273 TaxID=3070659 RepID=UPI0027DDB005|nr:trimeric intracellular cation channel family protein [Aestuariibaculum sp. YM273]WMI64457.1 trimeric intracellular cation channel family protein [Aestuariibaculum sp. YM273]
MLYIIDILGTIAFAISGALVAFDKRMDVFGIFIIAFVTSVGGGTLRDLLIGYTPVSWMNDLTYTYVIIASTIFAIGFRSKLNYLRTSLLLFDAIGIGLYTLVGLEKGVELHLHPILCIALGTMTACFGGVIRDILCNEIPVVFRRETIYATCCIMGGMAYFTLGALSLDHKIVFIASGVIIIATRLLAVRFKIALPNIYRD